MEESSEDRPKWLTELENRKQKLQLGHEIGAGAACLICNSACPGLDLHFWRKICKHCKCSRDDHDVHTKEFPQFELLFGSNGKTKTKKDPILLCIVKKKESIAVQTAFDWVPPNTTKELAEDYMKALPEEKLPIQGSIGATARKQQLQRQIPLHDLDDSPDRLNTEESKEFETYKEHLKDNAGQGIVSKISLEPIDPLNEINSLTLKDNERAEAVLRDALLPPSARHQEEVVASTLSNEGFKFIQKKLSEKYSQQGQVRPLNNPPSSIVCSQNLSNPILPQRATNLDLPKKALVVAKCYNCRGDICKGDVVVKAEKADNAVWHPGCFVCSTCKELLADLVYFYHKNQVYCARDFATHLGILRCFACDELIFSREYTVAEGHHYHVQHFCCWDCDVPLGGQQYITENDCPVCLNCYEKNYAKCCDTCRKAIAANQQAIVLKHLTFHTNEKCFSCSTCKKNLMNEKFLIRNDRLFCSKICATIVQSN